MPHVFRLGYRWELEGSIDAAFHYISHIATWPSWWPQIVSVETDHPDKSVVEVGDTARMRAKSFLPYCLEWETTIVRIEAPTMIEVESRVKLGRSFGMFGTVKFGLAELEGSVLILNRQQMVADRPVPRWLVPLAGKVFAFNHGYAMKRGLPGLQKLLTEPALSQSGSTGNCTGVVRL